MTANEDPPTWFVVMCSIALALAVLAIAGAVAFGIVKAIDAVLGG